MDGNIICVPVHLEAFLSESGVTAPALADFIRLPYVHPSKGDMNADQPYIGCTINAQPFENRDTPLKQGLHLHWSLPDALTTGRIVEKQQTETAGSLVEKKTEFPAVPNRWLVIRKWDNEERRWVVEGDYLNNNGTDNPHGAISYPIDNGSLSNSTENNIREQPFGFLGRKIDFDEWKEEQGHVRIKPLTAIGYGEPAFAAYYPSCHSVFGFHDPEIATSDQLKSLTYQVIGWFSDKNDDPLPDLNVVKAAGRDTMIIEDLSWSFSGDKMPDEMVCYAGVSFQPEAVLTNPAFQAPLSVSVGNTGTEALSARLAHEISAPERNRRKQIRDDAWEDLQKIQKEGKNYTALKKAANKHEKAEFDLKYGLRDWINVKEEQLESLVLRTDLENASVDIGHIFRATRHQQTFQPVSSAPHTILKRDEEIFVPSTIRMPDSLAQQLTKVNELASLLAQTQDKLSSKRHLLYADWYKYQLCSYPERGAHKSFPDVAKIWHATQSYIIPEIEQLEKDIKDLQRQKDEADSILQSSLTAFNTGQVEKNIFSIDFKDKNDPGFDFLEFRPEEKQWRDNQPFSQNCLSLQGNYFSYAHPQEAIRSVSMWVYLEAENDPDLELLFIKGEPLTALDRVVINRNEHPLPIPLTCRHLPKEAWAYVYVTFRKPLENQGKLQLLGHSDVGIKGKLAGFRIFNAPLTNDELDHDRNMLGHAQYSMVSTTGPRFWEPREPVLLLEGEAARPSLRHGHDRELQDDGYLPCRVVAVGKKGNLKTRLGLLEDQLFSIEAQSADQGIHVWKQQPWHPLFAEWQVSLASIDQEGDDSDSLNQEFIADNFTLEEWEPELAPKPHRRVHKNPPFSGRSIMTPFAKKHVKNAISTALEELEELRSENDGSFPDQEIDAYHSTLVESQEVLNNGHFVSQALGGFNASLLMHQIGLQLPISDPLSFSGTESNEGEALNADNAQAFAEIVGKYLNGHTLWGCSPELSFMPVRNGVMQLDQVRLVDTFGQIKTDFDSEVVKASTLQIPKDAVMGPWDNGCWLGPRWIQPARLEFRWLEANMAQKEVNSHPASSPVIGWLLCNHVDENLLVYDADGNGLGCIAANAQWIALPGESKPTSLVDVPDGLRKVVDKLCWTESTDTQNDDLQAYFQQFLKAIDHAVAFIGPERDVHDDDFAHLLGHPIAVTRAHIGFELKREPVKDSGWTAFHHYLESGERISDGFEEIKVPIRIGEENRLNDGVLGFWLESEDELDKTFHSVVTDVEDKTEGDQHIRKYDPEAPPLQLSPIDPLVEMTVLFDPRGKAHASSGMLPVKAIDIPNANYTKALKRISAGSFSTMLFTPEATSLPLRAESDHQWSWLEKDRFTWQERVEQPIVRKESLMLQFKDGGLLWDQMVARGWLKSLNPYRAAVVPYTERTTLFPSKEEISPDFVTPVQELELWLEQLSLHNTQTEARFCDQLTAREGWLRLEPATDTNKE